MQIEFIKVEEQDKAEIKGMFLPAMKSYIEKIWGWDIEWQNNEFETRYFGLNTSFIFINGNKTGYIQYSLNDDNTYLNMLILKPEFQNKGFGKLILNSIQDFQPDKILALSCFHINNKVLNFYLNNGFVQKFSEENFIRLERLT